MRSWFPRVVAALGSTALASTAFAGVAAAAEPSAAPAESHAEAQFLSGSLLNGLIPFDYLLALRGASATNTGQSTPVVQRNNEFVTLLGFLPIINNPHGTPIDPASAIQGGFAGQYAQASAGSARAASGALSDSGVFGDNQSTAFPSDATVDLSKMMGAGAFNGLQDATLKLSTISSEAAVSAGNVPATSCKDKTRPVDCLDYSAAAGTLSFTSPELEAVPAAVTKALAPIDEQTAQLEAAITEAVKTLQTGNDGLNTLLAALGGGSHLSAKVNLNLTQAVVQALTADISADGVTLNPTTGKVTIDIGAFVALNGQAPNTTLTDGQTLFDISPVIPKLKAAINQRITDAADAALASDSVAVHADASVLGTSKTGDPTILTDSVGNILTGVLDGAGRPIDPKLNLTTGISIDLNESLLSVANGSAPAKITATVLGVPLTVPVAPLTDALKTITAPVVSQANTTAQGLATQVAASFGATLQDQVKPATLSIPDFLTLRVNVQSQPDPGMYQVTALQVALNIPFGNFATINLATSRAGASNAGAAPLIAPAPPATDAAAGAPPSGPVSVTPPGAPMTATSPAAAQGPFSGPGSDVAPSVARAATNPSPADPLTTDAATSPSASPAGSAQLVDPTATSADVVTVADRSSVGQAASPQQWLALAVLVAMLTLTCTGAIRRRGTTEN